jgi:hypothetical protein
MQGSQKDGARVGRAQRRRRKGGDRCADIDGWYKERTRCGGVYTT